MTPTEMILRYFEYDHLPEHLQGVSRPFCDLARRVASEIPPKTSGPETTTCLRKLLEAKDCAVRAALHEKVSDRGRYDYETDPLGAAARSLTDLAESNGPDYR